MKPSRKFAARTALRRAAPRSARSQFHFAGGSASCIIGRVCSLADILPCGVVQSRRDGRSVYLKRENFRK